MTRTPTKITFTKHGDNKFQMSLYGELFFVYQNDIDYALAHPELYDVTMK